MSRTRRVFSCEFKLRVVQEVLSGASQASIARRYSLSANTVFNWVKAFRTGRLGGAATGDAQLSHLLAENRQLKELLSKQAFEIEFLKKPRPTNAS